jgi:hypothetical protein
MQDKPTGEKPASESTEEYRMPREEFERIMRKALQVPPMPPEQKPKAARPKRPTEH